MTPDNINRWIEYYYNRPDKKQEILNKGGKDER